MFVCFMKKVLVMFLICFVGLVSASVDVHDCAVDGYYYPFDVIRGEVNLTISGEDFFSEITSNDGDEISLSDFLIWNGVDYDCSPPDCSNDYDVLGGSEDEVFSVDVGGMSYGGFVLWGDDVVVTGIDFDIESGHDIPIEFRDNKEVTEINNVQIAPKGVKVFNPAFDVTTHDLISGIITENRVLEGNYKWEIEMLRGEV